MQATWFLEYHGCVVRTQIKELEKEIARLEHMAYVDPLTNVLNRRGLLVAMRKKPEFAQKKRRVEKRSAVYIYSLLLIDIDRFKTVNETYGHQEGDRTLKQVGRIIQRSVRKSDLVARWGGDEFLIALPGANRTTAERIGRKLQREIGHKTSKGAGISFGVSTRKRTRTFLSVLNAADKALYTMKRKHRAQ